MARIIALEWDDFEARVVVGNPRAGHVVVEEAFAIDLRSSGTTLRDDQGVVGEKIAAALAARHISPTTTLVAVGRPGIELKRLSLPPAPEDELPDLVRFAALREFTTLDEDWPLDFVPLASEGDEGQQVLAAAISPDLVQQIQKTCEQAHLKPSRLVLRPFAAASLLRRRRSEAPERIRMLVDLLTGEADLTVLVDDDVVLPRTVRLPGEYDTPQQTRALVGEIRRTIAAAQNQLGGERVEAIYLCGGRNEHEALAESIAADLDISVKRFDPVVAVDVARSVQKAPPQHPGRFAPLLGMLLEEADEQRHAIDFLNPRQKAAPPSQRRKYALIGGAVLSVVLLIVLLPKIMLWQLDAEIADLNRTFGDQGKPVKSAVELTKKVDQIERSWVSQDAVWLDELYDMSRPDEPQRRASFPPAEHAMLTKLSVSSIPRGGSISLQGVADGDATLADLHLRSRDDQHEYQPQSSKVIRGEKPFGTYGREFKAMVIVLNEAEQAARRRKKPASAKSTSRTSQGGK